MESDATPARKPREDGVRTRRAIVLEAVSLATVEGLEGLSIGGLAKALGISKSGLYAHFGSKLELQMAALDEAARQFTEEVFLPALKAPRGVKRLRALFENWIAWPSRAKLPGGCPIDAAGREYRHQPGPMRDAVFEREKQVARELRKAVQMAIDSGELSPRTEPEQVVFEMMGMILVAYQAEPIAGHDEAMRRGHEAFERLIKQHAA